MNKNSLRRVNKHEKHDEDLLIITQLFSLPSQSPSYSPVSSHSQRNFHGDNATLCLYPFFPHKVHFCACFGLITRLVTVSLEGKNQN